MTVCNMTIEGGGRAGMIAPDDTTFEWVAGREAAPDPLPLDEWRELRTDDGAAFDTEVVIDAGALSPQVTWGTTPGMVTDVTAAVPEPRDEGEERALEYMALERRHADPGDQRSIASSSARAPTRASATCARPPRSCAAAASPRRWTRWSCPAPSR